MIQEDRLLKLFFELIQTACPTRQERQVADKVTVKLADLGFGVVEDDTGLKIGGNAGNLIAYLPGTVAGPTLLFSAHLDCVDPCQGIEPVLQDGVIRSKGNTILGSDDKAGVAAILEALTVVKEKDLPHGPIQVIFTVAEEGGLNGSKHLDPQLLKADFGYILDSSGAPGEIILTAPGQNHIEVIFEGRKAHAGLAPEEGINAITVAADAIVNMKQGRIDEETTANVGIIEGGTATNIVPDRVKVICEARSRNEQKLADQTDAMVCACQAAAEKYGAKAQISVSTLYESFVLSKDHAVVALAEQAMKALGLKPVLTGTGGGSDGNFFNQYGLPSVILGVGMNKAHTTDENILEQDLYESARIVLSLIAEALKPDGGLV